MWIGDETKQVLERRPVVNSYNFFTVSCTDNKGDTKTYVQTCRSGETMYKAARVICFGDCSGEKVVDIFVDGHRVHYVGWRPDMEFCFADESGREVFYFFAPEWEH